MADTILTEREASLAVEDIGWRYLLDCLTTAVTVDSLFDACEVIRAAVDIAGPHANDHLRLRATADRVELTLQARGKFRVTTQDVDLARSITEAVRTAGYQTVAHPAHHSVQSLAIAIDAMDIPAARPWARPGWEPAARWQSSSFTATRPAMLWGAGAVIPARRVECAGDSGGDHHDGVPVFVVTRRAFEDQVLPVDAAAAEQYAV
ncbi:MAG: hypothetical protein ACRDN0_15765, partial [Trebonia sp.]